MIMGSLFNGGVLLPTLLDSIGLLEIGPFCLLELLDTVLYDKMPNNLWLFAGLSSL